MTNYVLCLACSALLCSLVHWHQQSVTINCVYQVHRPFQDSVESTCILYYQHVYYNCIFIDTHISDLYVHTYIIYMYQHIYYSYFHILYMYIYTCVYIYIIYIYVYIYIIFIYIFYTCILTCLQKNFQVINSE